MRMLAVVVIALVAACGGTDEVVVDAPAGDDAPADDGAALDSAIDAVAGDGATDSRRDGANDPDGVLCERPDQSCPVPQQVCCDVDGNVDMCVGVTAPCSGRPLACDGPEDCGPGTECCLFTDGSRCTQTGVCGTTGAISEVMCHVAAHCSVTVPNCCGTAPGPALDLYSVCRSGPCPQ